MLEKFIVKGFKNFGNEIIFDFSDVRDFQFNKECIKKKLLNKVIVYGKNSVGKSNLGLAIFDITTHLVDNNVSPGLYDNYLNADNGYEYAEFKYNFKIGKNRISYEYKKDKYRNLLVEKLLIDKELIFEYNHKNGNSNLDRLKKIVPSLNFEFLSGGMSILRYVVNNSVSSKLGILKELVHFVDKMLWFRSLDENRYIGYVKKSNDYYDYIFEKNNLEEFQKLLFKAGIEEKIIAKVDNEGNNKLYFDKMTPIPFFKVASNGTKALYTLFYWLTIGRKIGFLFIDEFDAYYHFELSEMIVSLLEEYDDMQVVLTSHNTNLLTNKIMRPDCFFILTKNKLTSLSNSTSRELREGHNLEKLYKSGEFDE